jgi:glucose/mannose transport system permease protein
MSETVNPRGPKPYEVTAGRIGLYAFLILLAMFFIAPLYVMIVTSMKTMDEIRLGQIFALPSSFNFNSWVTAWSTACTGLNCEGIAPGFWNSVMITIPSVILSILVGAINGYALSLWRVKCGELLFGLLMLGALLPAQIYLYPLVRGMSTIGLYNSLAGIVVIHVLFALPIVTLMFRNFYASVPVELFKAARVDGAGFWRILIEILLPISTPIIVVAVIMQLTGIWNDYLFGLIFAGRDNLPMTTQLNNLINTVTGERQYNVNMAATLLTAIVPLVAYFASGRWFVRGITAGAVKG